MSNVPSQHSSAVKKPGGRRTAAVAGACLIAAAAAGVLLCRNEIRAAYLLATRFERLGANAQGHREYRHIETGIVFVRLPGGTFWMGSTEEEERRVTEEWEEGLPPSPDWVESIDYFSAEKPRHAVQLSSFRGFYSRPEATARDPVARVAPPDVFHENGLGESGRVARGGGTRNPLFCRSATRLGYDPLTAGADIGFRPAFNLR